MQFSTRIGLAAAVLLGGCGDDDDGAASVGTAASTDTGTPTTTADTSGPTTTMTTDPTDGGSSTGGGEVIDLPDLEGTVVEVDLVALGAAPTPDVVTAYGVALAALAADHGGTLAGDPLRVTEPVIENPALPEVNAPLGAHVVTIVSFPTVQEAEAYLSDAARATVLDALGGPVAARQHLVATPVGFPVGAPILPLYGEVATRPAPAFWHFNALDTRDGTDDQLAMFFGMAAPLVIASGAEFSAALATQVVLDGTFPYERFTVTQWPDQAAFDDVHNDATFVEDIAPIRNGTLEGFIEARVLAPGQ